MSWLTDEDRYFWNEGSHIRSYEKLGAHPDEDGTWFAVWAPHADEVSVIGDFNGWNSHAHAMERTGGGLWQVHVPGAQAGQCYKFHIRRGRYQGDKADPFAFAMEPPAGEGQTSMGLSSIITDLRHDWHDADWMVARTEAHETLRQPLSIYEVHLGSWRHNSPGHSLSYREIARPLADHVQRMGFTHVEFLPLAEHPYYGSWGYQTVGYYAPTFRHGSPQDLMYLIDYLHQHGIGVLLDWVPGHFASDPQALVFFDGSTLFEQDDPYMRYHPDWGTFVFDFGKPGVRSFLVSNALFWLDRYHIDGLRVDAVASMLYRDYSRSQWTPNRFGGRENLEAISLLKQTNEAVFAEHPTAMMIAEESTAWPGVSAPTYDDGLGFLFKWNMGWMNDTLAYMEENPVNRKHHHDKLTFSLMYAFSEHFVLPFSHDEVVHLKGSLWQKMPGDPWQQAANLRVLYGYQFGHPGKKLLFMGTEFGQLREWNHDASLDWHLIQDPAHAGVMRWVADLNTLYRKHPALWIDTPEGFQWIDFSDSDQSIISFERRSGNEVLVFVINFTPVPRPNYRIGVPEEGLWQERLNSDATLYGGTGVGNLGVTESAPVPYHHRPASIVITLPPLSVLVLEKSAET